MRAERLDRVGLAAFHFVLHKVEQFRLDDRRMAAFHIILLGLALVELDLFLQIIHCHRLLEQRVVRMLSTTLARHVVFPPGVEMPASVRHRAIAFGALP